MAALQWLVRQAWYAYMSILIVRKLKRAATSGGTDDPAGQGKPMSDYRLRLSFDDGVQGEVDLSHSVGKGVFALWNDPQQFEKVAIGSGGS